MRRSDRLHRVDAGATPLRAGRELLLSFAFRCNLACRFCYVEDGLGGKFRGVDLDEARRLLADPRLTAGVTRIILSGGEVTLDKQLGEYVALARAVPSVEHVRIQTNATRLAEGDLAARLISAGIDEFFVSLHGADAATCDAITQVPGSFDAIVGGLDALRALGATVVTNTVVCAANVGQLEAIVALAHQHGARGAELWGYVPRVDAVDDRQQLVRVAEAAPHLQRALATAEARGLPVVVKYFPRCLLGAFAHTHSDVQPRLIIDDVFWKDYPQYGCLYEGVCSAAADDDGCSGLSDAYVRRFGWEETTLVPFEERTPSVNLPVVAAYHAWNDEPPATAASATVAAPDAPGLLAALGLVEGATLAGHRVGLARRHAGAVRLRFVSDRDAIEVDLWPRRPERPGFARTASLTLSHPLLSDEAQARARPLFAALTAHLHAREGGNGALSAIVSGPATEPETVPEPVTDLARHAARPALLPGWPGVDHRRARDFLAACTDLISRGQLRRREVEPSLGLGGVDALRAIVNPSVPGPGRDRPAIARALLDAMGGPRWLADLAAAWLAVDAQVAFLGLVADPTAPDDAPVRTKLYLQTPTPATRQAAARVLGCAVHDSVMIAVDALGDRRAALKRYARIAAAEARARFDGPLLTLLEARGLLLGELPLLAATRTDAAGTLVDDALHVDVTGFPQLDLGAAWARACGDARAAAIIAASGRATRVLSASVAGRHVYLDGDDA